MKPKALFDLNILKNEKTVVYIILPEINLVTFEVISHCIEFLNKYEKIVFLCSFFEHSFYQLLVNKSKSFDDFKHKVEIDIISTAKFIELQSRQCLLVSLNDGYTTPDHNKRAILCLPSVHSDIVFDELESEVPLTITSYLSKLFTFLQIEKKKLFQSIELSHELVVKSSSIANSLKETNYHVIILKSYLSTIKVANTLKKNKLKKQLIVISSHKLNVHDPKLFYYKDYSYLDYLAFALQAESISCPPSEQYKNVITNLRINLSIMTLYRDSTFILDDIAEPKVNA